MNATEAAVAHHHQLITRFWRTSTIASTSRHLDRRGRSPSRPVAPAPGRSAAIDSRREDKTRGLRRDKLSGNRAFIAPRFIVFERGSNTATIRLCGCDCAQRRDRHRERRRVMREVVDHRDTAGDAAHFEPAFNATKLGERGQGISGGTPDVMQRQRSPRARSSGCAAPASASLQRADRRSSSATSNVRARLRRASCHLGVAERLQLRPAAALQDALDRGIAGVGNDACRSTAMCGPDDGTALRSRPDRQRCRRGRTPGCSASTVRGR